MPENDPDTPPGHEPSNIDHAIAFLLRSIEDEGNLAQRAFKRAACDGEIISYGNHCARRALLYQALVIAKSARSPALSRKAILAIGEQPKPIPLEPGRGGRKLDDVA